ncbi:hypothetical protein [Hyphomicrobium sp. 802]|uniref:hypothetical protein n=1 Tax=Hyphomicrobium sp. 802 TaxID=1112272 RepID=UPI00045E89E5|nr:hypothetical protein [Hyphomicrobium sp. 802]
MTLINARPGSKTRPAQLQLSDGRDVWLTMMALGDGSVGIKVGNDGLHVDSASFREFASWVAMVALQQDPMSIAQSDEKNRT